MSAPIPRSVQVSFLINHIKGDHVGKQAAVVSVNGHRFILYPKTVQKRFRFYDRGFTLYLDFRKYVKISIGVITPTKEKGFLHCVCQYVVAPSFDTVVHNVNLHPAGGSHIVNMSVYMCPSYAYEPFPAVTYDGGEISTDEDKKSTDESKSDSYDLLDSTSILDPNDS